MGQGAQNGVIQQDIALDQEDGPSKDNGFVKPAVTDIESAASELTVELGFDEKMAILEKAVVKHPLNREILYKMLGFCIEEQALELCETQIESCPEFKVATQNPYRMMETLTRAYGVDVIERDAEGTVVFPEQKADLTEDEVDNLVSTISYKTTEVGQEFFRLHTPKARLVELMNLTPERSDIYIELLEFVGQQPRSYKEIEDLLHDRPALETIIDGVRETMQPSVFVDKLERSGALVWNKGWSLTKEGESFLKDLKVTG